MKSNIQEHIINFAKKYAGQDVFLIEGTYSKPLIVRVIGYYYVPGSEMMLVIDYPYNKDRQANCWEINQQSGYVTLTIEEAKHGNAFPIDKIKPIIKSNPYPHTCKHCRSPARITNIINICSNVNCKSRRNYMNNLRKK